MISTIYRRANDGSILRLIQVLWGGFFVEDGGYMAQHVIAEFEDTVKESDEDYADAVAWVREVEAEDYLTQFE
jgi:hypothetical protein